MHTEFGVFVDTFGRRSRKHNIRWSGLPLAFSKLMFSLNIRIRNICYEL